MIRTRLEEKGKKGVGDDENTYLLISLKKSKKSPTEAVEIKDFLLKQCNKKGELPRLECFVHYFLLMQ